MPSPLVFVHICGAVIGLISGAVAMVVRKGSFRHRVAGIVFGVSMLGMSSSAIYIAVGKSQPTNYLVGLLTFYLVTTGWVAIRRREKKTGSFDWAALMAVSAAAIAFVGFGVRALDYHGAPGHGAPPVAYFIFGFVALCFAVSDIRVLARGGVAGAQRIARHLWRMCFALLIGAFSLYPGRPSVFPESWRRSQLLYTPVILLIIAMSYWLRRVSRTKASRRAAVPDQALNDGALLQGKALQG